MQRGLSHVRGHELALIQAYLHPCLVAVSLRIKSHAKTQIQKLLNAKGVLLMPPRLDFHAICMPTQHGHAADSNALMRSLLSGLTKTAMNIYIVPDSMH